ncbi:glycine--tRNA ligase subunit beta [Candidatus Pelagibacter communis]|uniref:glycine--tRNA ligase subunit beta n=1 Tax=Pelagibacter ubique TaxID=198252 RepID=UPI00094D7BC0|nr:glycine--tRNA ligase subunit beta [Candidatus Pelagibacter ubique]
MSEFFLELFSEEIPATLQKTARENLQKNFEDFLKKEEIKFKDSISVLSTPNRLVVYCENISQKIIKPEAEIRGPSVNAPEQALNGFIKSNNITKEETFIRKTDKGEFYFFKKPAQTVETKSILQKNLPKILDEIPWKKSMRWGDHDLYWGRPLKSILACFDNKFLEFSYHHLNSSNFTYLDKDFEEKTSKFSNFKTYKEFFKSKGIILDHNKREEFIENQLLKKTKLDRLKLTPNKKLLTEVTNIVEKPNIIKCTFDKRFLKIPKEILVTTMEVHQKYFPTFDNKDNLTNVFFVVADNSDTKGLIRLGNERVVEARLNDAQFFWDKNKTKNLVKGISDLKNVNYFEGLGTYFDKTQRLRKLGSLISDELLISKEKVEVASSICKVDLVSDLVGEFPELQGVMGGHFAKAQGFDNETCLAISEHYLPTGPETKTPKKPYSVTLALSDKIDTLVGFFTINLKPSSSKDPFALRRSAIGLIRLIIENKLEIKLKDLINYSCVLFGEQDIDFDIKTVQQDLFNFFSERLKFYMKEKKIRPDIIECSINSYSADQIYKIYNKAFILNKLIDKNIGQDVIFSYKRASNILSNEISKNNIELENSTDPGLFKNDFEKKLYKKIQEIRKYFTSLGSREDCKKTLEVLADAKTDVSNFFDNVIVNDEDEAIKKNRLELVQLLCKTFNNYLNFSNIESA